MKARKFFVGRAIGFLILVFIIGAFYVVKEFVIKPNQAPSNTDLATDTNTIDSSSDKSLYTERDGLFSFEYNPEFVIVEGDKTRALYGWTNNLTTEGLILLTLAVSKNYMPSTNFYGAKLTIGRSVAPTDLRHCNYDKNIEEKNIINTEVAGYPAKKFVYSDAGAGNFYDTTSYRLILNKSCYVVEYIIHYTNKDNYPKEQGVKEFNRSKIDKELEQIVKTLKFNLPSN